MRQKSDRSMPAVTRASNDLKYRMRVQSWKAARRTLNAPPRVDNEKLATARAAHGEGRYEAAIDEISSDPSWEVDSAALRLRGLCAAGLDSLEEAQEFYKRSYRHNLNNASRDLFNIVDLLLRERNYEMAEKTARQAINLDPEWVGGWIGLLSVLNRANDKRKLLSALKAMKSAPGSPGVHPAFLERLENDPDLMGVRDLVVEHQAEFGFDGRRN